MILIIILISSSWLGQMPS